MSLFDLLFGKKYENDTIENETLYDLQLAANRAKVSRDECVTITLVNLIVIAGTSLIVFFMSLGVSAFPIKTLIFGILVTAILLPIWLNFKYKKSAVELRYEAAKKEYDDLELKKTMLQSAHVAFKYDSCYTNAVFEKLERKLFNYLFDKFKIENRKPKYFEIDELFFGKLKAFLELKEDYHNQFADKETRENYDEIKSLLYKHACEYYESIEDFKVRQNKIMVDITLKVFKELEGKI